MESNLSEESSNMKGLVINKHLENIEKDHLYHLGLNTQMRHFNNIFSDVRFVLFGGSRNRMEKLAKQFYSELKLDISNPGLEVSNIAEKTDRYAIFKVKEVLFINHGIGMASCHVVLHEVIKALFYSKAENFKFIRVGTSGGIGIDPGTIVLTKETLDSCFRNYLEEPILGKMVQRKAILDQNLNQQIKLCHLPTDDFQVIIANTICSWDFYEGQARLDGAICDYTDVDKEAFLKEAYSRGVRNIEMESVVFGAIAGKANIPTAVVCVTLINRFNGDQVTTSHEDLVRIENSPITLVIRFLKKELNC